MRVWHASAASTSIASTSIASLTRASSRRPISSIVALSRRYSAPSPCSSASAGANAAVSVSSVRRTFLEHFGGSPTNNSNTSKSNGNSNSNSNSTTTTRLNDRIIEPFSTKHKKHVVVPSASLVPPSGDSSLLFTAAGMVPFKNAFLGLSEPPGPAVTSSQLCLRVNDLSLVGKTRRHQTLFEMLGTFSFGGESGGSSDGLSDAYGPRDMQYMAWHFLTQVVGLDERRMRVTVHPEDSAARDTWRDLGLPNSRILPEAENFWTMGGGGGDSSGVGGGPCGPCTEIYYDVGTPDSDGEQWLELWNLVFMKFRQVPLGAGDSSDATARFGGRNGVGDLVPLSRVSVDTGMGLERLSSVLQGKTNNFEVDLMLALQFEFCSSLLGIGETDAQAIVQGSPATALEALKSCHRRSSGAPPSMRDLDTCRYGLKVLADHLRAAAFLICDGVVPSNVGRGYVLRRLIRRCVRVEADLVKLGNQAAVAVAEGEDAGIVPPSILATALPTLAKEMGDAYPMLVERSSVIAAVLHNEEEAFVHTLGAGLRRVQQALASAAPDGTLTASVLFDLYTRFGFPMDMTESIARESGGSADLAGAQALLEQQRVSSRAVHDWQAGETTRTAPPGVVVWQRETIQPTFVGYDRLRVESFNGVLRFVSDDAGGCIWISLRESPFYPNGGGQVGDTGTLLIENSSGAILEADVLDTLNAYPGCGGVLCVVPKPGDDLSTLLQHLRADGSTQRIVAQVDADRRAASARHHTGTHMLNAALRHVLVDSQPAAAAARGVVHQAGSFVSPERLRFDFTWPAALSLQQLRDVEHTVQNIIRADVAVRASEESASAAIASGAMALFGEKYGNKVRVIRFAEAEPHRPICASAELCGGTHVARTGEVGAFVITSERSVAVNTRRIEALCGQAAVDWLLSRSDMLRGIASTLEVPDAPLGQSPSDLGHEHSAINAIERLRRETRERLVELRVLRRKLEAVSADSAFEVRLPLGGTRSVQDVRVHVYSDDDPLALRRHAAKFTDGTDADLPHVLVGGQHVLVVASPESGADAGSIIRGVFEFVCAGRGGGKRLFAQGKIDDSMNALSQDDWRLRFDNAAAAAK